MQLDVYQPTFIVEIKCRKPSKDITHEITSFVFEENEEELKLWWFRYIRVMLSFGSQPRCYYQGISGSIYAT